MRRFFYVLLFCGLWPLPLQAALPESPVPVADGVVIHRLVIPMSDGVRLAGDLYAPADLAPGERRPVLLEYSPYRKDDGHARNVGTYHYFLERGYLVARVDIRGTGASEGQLIPYEYSDIELDDGEVVIGWLAAQPWSTGAVGMFGISWSGFNAIQMAMRAPPAYKAFVAIMATEDLYQEDVHYMDGIIHIDSWMMSQDLYNALPAGPEFLLDDRWRKRRFETEPSIFTYLREQRDGPFWDRASARDKHGKVRVPGFHIGGWYDGYRNSVTRMVENSAAPAHGMVGPWDHFFPHDAWPGQSIEWRSEAVRWFDQWMKGVDTGILDEPKLTLFQRDWHPPDASIDTVPGTWRRYDDWPPPGRSVRALHATVDGGLAGSAPDPATLELVYRPSNGVEGGGPVMWWGAVAPDQQPTDDHSLVFETEPLEEPLSIVGRPWARLSVAADSPQANWVARLSDVSPQGQVTQVAGAAFNGTHRHSARSPEALLPGESFALDIEMHLTSWTFPAGHRIRLAVNHGQWPMLWPTPYPFTGTLALGGANGARLELPVAPADDGRRPAYPTPEEGPVVLHEKTLDSGNVTGYGEVKEVQRDAESGDALAVVTNSGGWQFGWGVQRFEERIEHRTNEHDPASSSMRGTYALETEAGERRFRLEAEIEVRSDQGSFHVRFVRRLVRDGEETLERTWEETIPRDFQ